MTTSMKRWFAPPIFEGDEEKTLRASFLNAILMVFTLNSSLTAFAMLHG